MGCFSVSDLDWPSHFLFLQLRSRLSNSCTFSNSDLVMSLSCWYSVAPSCHMVKASLWSRVYRPITVHSSPTSSRSPASYAQLVSGHVFFSPTSICTFRPQSVVPSLCPLEWPLPSSPTSQWCPTLPVGHRPNATTSVELSSPPPELFFLPCATTTYVWCDSRTPQSNITNITIFNSWYNLGINLPH